MYPPQPAISYWRGVAKDEAGYRNLFVERAILGPNKPNICGIKGTGMAFADLANRTDHICPIGRVR